jgi:hypothetical protein
MTFQKCHKSPTWNPVTSPLPSGWQNDGGIHQKRNCRDCGQEFAWTAKQQQYWFEVLKLPIQVQALRCSACSRKLRLAKAAQKAHQAKIASK